MRKTVDHVNQMAAADDVLEAVHAVMHRVRAQQQHALRDADGNESLTPLEARVLGFFARHPGATQSELAAHVGRDKGQLARLVGGLRERGWLLAEADAEDRRAVRLVPSEAARQRHQAAMRARRRLAEAAAAGLSDTERRQLLALLQRVLANLDALGV